MKCDLDMMSQDSLLQGFDSEHQLLPRGGTMYFSSLSKRSNRSLASSGHRYRRVLCSHSGTWTLPEKAKHCKLMAFFIHIYYVFNYLVISILNMSPISCIQHMSSLSNGLSCCVEKHMGKIPVILTESCYSAT